jgi:hypothetical protein
VEKLRDANHKNTVLKELDAARLQVRVFLFILGHTMLDKSWSRIVNQRVQKSVLRNMYTILLMESKHSLYLKSIPILLLFCNFIMNIFIMKTGYEQIGPA